jgi:uncharacterized protein
MLTYHFRQPVTSLAALREIVGEPWELNLCKQLSSLDRHCRAFIARSPFVLIGTSDAAGRCDVSPKGDSPGFVRPLDEHMLVIPDRPGNRRADTLSNILENAHVGLLFIIPGMDETLRVNGRAQIVQDEDILAQCTVNGKTPLLGIAVEVEECFVHCGRSFIRAQLWDRTSWLPRHALPSTAQILMDHARPSDISIEELEQEIEAAYRRLY